ncbi:hypothetical protein WDW37_20705 [Bdellovibrionota bacterium FG-1]
MKSSFTFLFLSLSLALAGESHAATCTISPSATLVTVRCPCPQVQVTCEGKTGFIFLLDIPQDKRSAGATFTVRNSAKDPLNLYATQEETWFDQNQIISTFSSNASSSANAGDPVCEYDGNVKLIKGSNFTNDSGVSCGEVKVCIAKVKCKVGADTKNGAVSCAANLDGTCPSVGKCQKDGNFTTSALPFKDPHLPVISEKGPAPGKDLDCAYEQLSLFKGKTPGCGSFTFCTGRALCAKNDPAVIRGVNFSVVHAVVGCRQITSSGGANPDSQGCPRDTNACADDPTFSLVTAKISDTGNSLGNGGSGGGNSGEAR